MNSKPSLLAELAAELLGTMAFILFVNGVVAMVAIFQHVTLVKTIHGDFTNMTLGWRLAVTMGI